MRSRSREDIGRSTDDRLGDFHSHASQCRFMVPEEEPRLCRNIIANVASGYFRSYDRDKCVGLLLEMAKATSL